ncbi:MAG: hypothetical protein H7246_13375 [Phycisphaerae bacterium]|nr:hypothetical protein [Saprospiraceae bacterium]
MKFNLKNSTPKPSILALFSFFILSLAFTACTKDPIIPIGTNPPVELEKKILDFYIPFKNIVINEEKRQIINYETKDFNDYKNLTPDIEVSNGVTISPASGVTVDATKPVTYTLTATDGSKATYALIICNVEWEYDEVRSGGASTTRLAFLDEPWTAVSHNGVLTLHFGWDDESSIDIYLKIPISSALVSQFPVGNYTPANVPAGKAGATFVYRENGIVKTFASPLSGNLTITQYDAAKSTISGSFAQIKYSGIGTETQGNTYLSGTFENLPLEIK